MSDRSETKASGVRWVAALTVVGLLAFAGTAVAGQAGKGVQVQGVQVHVDPATGQVRQPSPSEVKALADAVRALFAARSVQAAQVNTHADGSVSAKLGPESLNVWVATVGPDGSLRQVCVEGAGAAGAVQGGPALEVK